MWVWLPPQPAPHLGILPPLGPEQWEPRYPGRRPSTEPLPKLQRLAPPPAATTRPSADRPTRLLSLVPKPPSMLRQVLKLVAPKPPPSQPRKPPPTTPSKEPPPRTTLSSAVAAQQQRSAAAGQQQRSAAAVAQQPGRLCKPARLRPTTRAVQEMSACRGATPLCSLPQAAKFLMMSSVVSRGEKVQNSLLDHLKLSNNRCRIEVQNLEPKWLEPK